ncbi:MAG: hypothetical protein IJD58_01510 [Lachnospiraceae bacterium]|nr:hypothetical protein [Lachnospiraceae bacterium]
MEIIDGIATRIVKLENIDNGHIEECFDDSALISDDNFDFMVKGLKYDCKIKLFGEPAFESTKESIDCKIISYNLKVGKVFMVEVESDNNKYYVSQEKVVKYLKCDSFKFCYTRKDLIQVDEVVHPDLM